MGFNTPILFIIFNRHEPAKLVFERIRAMKPTKLFIAADGPRIDKPGEAEKCELLRRELVSMIDWNCELKTLFRSSNLGCGRGPAEAITWFFSQVESGIVLEDDCLPGESFFYFCEELLERYKFEEGVMMISGFNALGKWHHTELDYFFTEGSIWGWASWQRAWNKYDFSLAQYRSLLHRQSFVEIINGSYPELAAGCDAVLSGSIDAWDYQWFFARVIHNGLSITPSVNLIENIGFGGDATHTKWVGHPLRKNEVRSLDFPLRVNSVLVRDPIYEKKTAEKISPKVSRLQDAKNKIKRLLFRVFNIG